MKLAARLALGLMTTLLLAATAATLAHAQLPAAGQPGAVPDPRYCGEPERTPDGRIKRSRTVLREFARVFPCPETLQPVPSCPGWGIDHILPLASGGCDSVINLQWLPDSIKRCADDDCKDRWERTYHGHPRKPIVLP
jgi:hypothetical protein